MISNCQLSAAGLSAAAIRRLGPAIRTLAFVLVASIVVEQAIVCVEIAKTTLTVRKMADFGVFYESAARARHGADPYSPDSAAAAPNLNPPHVTLLLEPLTLLSPAAAFALWTVANLLSAAWAIRLIFRELDLRANMTTILWASLAVAASATTGAQWYSAQLSWLLWGPATWAWAEARHGRLTYAAVVVGGLASVKPFIGLLALSFVIARAWRNLAVFLVVMTGCLSAGVLALGLGATASWLHDVESVTWTGHIFNTSIFGVLTRLFGDPARLPAWNLLRFAHDPALIVPLWLTGALLVLAVTSAALSRFDAAADGPFEVDRMWAAALSGGLLVFPLSWVYYCCLLAAPYAALCADRRWWRALGSRRLFLGIPAVSLFLAPGLLTSLQPNRWATAGIGSLYFWGVAALWGCVVASAWPRSAAPATTSARSSRPSSTP